MSSIPGHADDVGTEPKVRDKFVLGLDYGTTFAAGAAYCLTRDLVTFGTRSIKPIRGYPGAPTTGSKGKSTEVPTIIQYDQKVQRIGYAAALKELEDPDTVPNAIVRAAKIGLDPWSRNVAIRSSLREEIEAVNNLRGTSKSVADIMEDYAKALFDVFYSWLVKECGFDEKVDSVELNVAVPFIWDQKVLRLMVRLLERAGKHSKLSFGKAIKLWWEPEAALEHILTEMPLLDPQIDDCVMVVDGGGGSTDVTSFIILQPKPNLRLQEAAQGEGILCGSTDIDEAFCEQTRLRLRDTTVFGRLSDHALKPTLRKAVADFVRDVKPVFGDDISNYFRIITIPGLLPDPAKGFREDRLMINEEQLESLFRPVAMKVWNLVKAQLQAVRDNRHKKSSVQKIIGVGGLLQSPYITQFLRAQLDTHAKTNGLPKPIDFIVPEGVLPHAVAAGAVACARRTVDQAVQRLNRSSVGFVCHQKYDSKKPGHQAARVANPDMEPDTLDREIYVHNCVDWLLQKNERQSNGVHRIELTRTIPENGQGVYCLDLRLYISDTCTESGYTLDHEKNKDCELWEQIEFDLDMEAVRKTHKLKTAKTKPKAKRKAASKSTPQQPTRRSARLQSRLPTLIERQEISQLSERLEVSHISSKSRRGGKRVDRPHDSDQNTPTACQAESLLSSPSSESDLISSSAAEEVEEAERYYDVKINLEMEFIGVLAEFNLDCPAMGKKMPGTVNLAAAYLPGTA